MTDQGARLPSQRRYAARADAARTGKVRINAVTMEQVLLLRHGDDR